jgi:hypothetical protein
MKSRIEGVLKGVVDYDLSIEDFFKLKDIEILMEVIISNWPQEEFFKFRPHIRRRGRSDRQKGEVINEKMVCGQYNNIGQIQGWKSRQIPGLGKY